MTNVILTSEERLQKWVELQEHLKNLKAEEASLRKAVIADQFPAHKLEGAETVKLVEGWKLKATFKQNYGWEEGRDFSFNIFDLTGGVDLNELCGELQELSDAEEIIKSIFKVKIEFNATAYKKMLPTVQSVIEPYIVIKEASTSLELVAPKDVELDWERPSF